MTITEFLDTKLDKDTDDIVFIDSSNKRFKPIDYDTSLISSVTYKKIAIIKIK